MRDRYEETISTLKTDGDRAREIFHLAIVVIIALGIIIGFLTLHAAKFCR